MLISTKSVLRCTVESQEGTVGILEDLFFDDHRWEFRYLVVGTRGWLFRHRVLLPPAVVEQADWPNGRLRVRLSREQIENAPDVEAHRPVSRQKQLELAQYPLWTPIGGFVPTALLEQADRECVNDPDANLRSIREVTGYHVEGTDGTIGHVTEAILNDEAAAGHPWHVVYLIVETGGWLAGRKVPVAPSWATSIRWDERAVHVNVTRLQIKESPEFDPEAPINRRFEEVLYDYYGKPRELVVHSH